MHSELKVYDQNINKIEINFLFTEKAPVATRPSQSVRILDIIRRWDGSSNVLQWPNRGDSDFQNLFIFGNVKLGKWEQQFELDLKRKMI